MVGRKDARCNRPLIVQSFRAWDFPNIDVSLLDSGDPPPVLGARGGSKYRARIKEPQFEMIPLPFELSRCRAR